MLAEQQKAIVITPKNKTTIETLDAEADPEDRAEDKAEADDIVTNLITDDSKEDYFKEDGQAKTDSKSTAKKR